MASVMGINDFAFQTGQWRVRHRKLAHRLAGSDDWREFDGACAAWEVMGGAGNVDDHLLRDPVGSYRAATLRRYDPATDQWSIWWWDSRLSEIGPPVCGRFDAGVGTFLGEDEVDGRPILVRFVWSGITTTRAHWEQAFSADGGAGWETNWAMDFERAP